MQTRFFVLAAVFLSVVSANAQIHSRSPRTQRFSSPDGKLVAVIRSRKAPEATTESRVELLSESRRVLARRNYTSPDGEHGYGVTKAEWTPDSQFFVYSLESSGGHQSWHTPVLFFSRRENRIVRLDDALKDAVSNPQFVISSPDRVKVELWFSKQTRTVALHTLQRNEGQRENARQRCTSQEAIDAENNTDRLDTWNDVYQSFSRFSQCDDGSIAEGYSEAVTNLLAEKWDQFPKLVQISRSDKRFEAFVLRHVDETVPQERLSKLADNASRKCPPGAQELCKRIVRAVSP